MFQARNFVALSFMNFFSSKLKGFYSNFDKQVQVDQFEIP